MTRKQSDAIQEAMQFLRQSEKLTELGNCLLKKNPRAFEAAALLLFRDAESSCLAEISKGWLHRCFAWEPAPSLDGVDALPGEQEIMDEIALQDLID